MSLIKPESDETRKWATGLELRGLYYEGYTDNLQELLCKHSSATITTYGVRKSHSSKGALVECCVDNKENENVQVNMMASFYCHFIEM